jgi:hypothetical protein
MTGPCADARDRLIAALQIWHVNEAFPALSDEVRESLIQLNTATGSQIEAIGDFR